MPGRPRSLKEITRTRFWQLEDFLNSDKGKETFGKIIKTNRGNDVVYRNDDGNLLMSVDGVYFAHHTVDSAAD